MSELSFSILAAARVFFRSRRDTSIEILAPETAGNVVHVHACQRRACAREIRSRVGSVPGRCRLQIVQTRTLLIQLQRAVAETSPMGLVRPCRRL